VLPHPQFPSASVGVVGLASVVALVAVTAGSRTVGIPDKAHIDPQEDRRVLGHQDSLVGNHTPEVLVDTAAVAVEAVPRIVVVVDTEKVEAASVPPVVRNTVEVPLAVRMRDAPDKEVAPDTPDEADKAADIPHTAAEAAAPDGAAPRIARLTPVADVVEQEVPAGAEALECVLVAPVAEQLHFVPATAGGL
jgi:hypothetical protein